MAKIKINAKGMPGVIFIDRNIHDEAVVISGSLSVQNVTGGLDECVAQELEAAARMINERDGVIGHIKAAVSTTAIDMISVTEEKAMIKKSPLCNARITLTVIVFLIEPEAAEDITRKTLAAIRKRCKELAT